MFDPSVDRVGVRLIGELAFDALIAEGSYIQQQSVRLRRRGRILRLHSFNCRRDTHDGSETLSSLQRLETKRAAMLSALGHVVLTGITNLTTEQSINCTIVQLNPEIVRLRRTSAPLNVRAWPAAQT